MPTFDEVRALCLGLPEVEEILTWQTDVTFRVRGKIFVIGGDGATAISIKATPDVQADLIDLDPGAFRSAPYTGRFGWVVVDLERVDAAMLSRLLRDAWRRTAPARLRGALAE